MPNKNIRIAITGTSGFIGKNLLTHLVDRTEHVVSEISNFETLEADLAGLGASDFIVHLAAATPSKNDAEFEAGNPDLTRKLCEALRAIGGKPTIIYVSSTASEQDDGFSRSTAAEQVLQDHQATVGATAITFRLPDVFGKWAKPNHDSIIATYCYNLAHDVDFTISDPSRQLHLVYIDDLVEDLLDIFSSAAPLQPGYAVREASHSYNTTVSEIAGQIKRLKESRDSLIVEPVGTGLERALHATYLSYLEPDQFTHDLVSHNDQRGSFVEMVKTTNSGQVSFFSAVPGATRGGHYHHTKTEKFLVISGTALFRFCHRLSGEIHEITTSGQQPTIVETVPGWSHNLKNVGDDELLLILWSSELYDQARPDTYTTDMELGT